MRVHELIQHLMSKCQPNDYVFINQNPAVMTLNGTGYVAITDHMIEQRKDTVEIDGIEYELVKR